MADINENEKQEYIKKLVNISRERAKYVGIDHALDIYCLVSLPAIYR